MTSAEIPSGNILVTSARLAYWLKGTSRTGACTKGLHPSAPLPTLSNVVLQKKVTIGVFSDPKLISIEVDFLPGATFTQGTVIEFLTGYLNPEFSNFGYIDLNTKRFSDFAASDYQELVGMGFPKGSFSLSVRTAHRTDPIVAYRDDSMAMGAYFPLHQLKDYSSFDGYNSYKFNLSTPNISGYSEKNATTKWSLAVRESAQLSTQKADQSRSFIVYLSVGTKREVIQSILNAMGADM